MLRTFSSVVVVHGDACRTDARHDAYAAEDEHQRVLSHELGHVVSFLSVNPVSRPGINISRSDQATKPGAMHLIAYTVKIA